MLTTNLNLRVAGSRRDLEKPNHDNSSTHRRTASMPAGFSVNSKFPGDSWNTRKFADRKPYPEATQYGELKTPTHREHDLTSVQQLAASAEGKLLRNSTTKVSKFERSFSGRILEGSTVSISTANNQFGGSFLNNLDRLISQLQSRTVTPQITSKGGKNSDLGHFTPQSQLKQADRQISKPKSKRGQSNVLNALKQSLVIRESDLDHQRERTQRTPFTAQASRDSEVTHQRDTVKTNKLSAFGLRRSSLAARKTQVSKIFADGLDRSSTGPTSYNNSQLDVVAVLPTARATGRSNSLPKFLEDNYASSLSHSGLLRRSTLANIEAPGYYLSKDQFEMLTERCSFAIQKYQECEQKIERLEKEYSKLKSRTASTNKLGGRRVSQENTNQRLGGSPPADETQQQVTTSSSSGWWPGSNQAFKGKKQSLQVPGNRLGDSEDGTDQNPESSNDRNDTLPMALAPRKKVFDFLPPNPGVCFTGHSEKPIKRVADRKQSTTNQSGKVTLQTVKDRLRDKLGQPENSFGNREGMSRKQITM